MKKNGLVLRSSSKKTLTDYFSAYGLTIFTVLISSGLILVVLLLSSITLKPYLISEKNQTSNVTESVTMNVDQSLSEKIEKLSPSENNRADDLNIDRSPFSE